MKFQALRRVRFSDCDPAGIVFFPRYLVMLGGVVEEWFERGLSNTFALMGGILAGMEMKHASRGPGVLRRFHSVQHAQVVLAQEGRVLRLSGGLGPLQDMAVVGVLTIVTAAGTGAEADKHFLRMTYRVAGGAEAGLDKFAPAVDGVIGEQFKRLKSLIETGSAN